MTSIQPGLDDIDLAGIKATLESGIKTRRLMGITIRKPKPQEFFRIHPDWYFPCYVLEFQGENLVPEHWLLAPQIAGILQNDLTYLGLYAAVNLKHEIYLVVVKEGNARNSWVSSMLEAIHTAKIYWTRIRADNPTGRYIIDVAEEDLGEPKWPQTCDVSAAEGIENRPVTMELLIRLAFRDHYVQNPDHEIIKRVKGRRV